MLEHGSLTIFKLWRSASKAQAPNIGDEVQHPVFMIVEALITLSRTWDKGHGIRNTGYKSF